MQGNESVFKCIPERLLDHLVHDHRQRGPGGPLCAHRGFLLRMHCIQARRDLGDQAVLEAGRGTPQLDRKRCFAAL